MAGEKHASEGIYTLVVKPKVNIPGVQNGGRNLKEAQQQGVMSSNFVRKKIGKSYLQNE